MVDIPEAKRRRLDRMLATVECILRKIWVANREVDVWIRDKCSEPEDEAEEGVHNVVRDLQGEMEAESSTPKPSVPLIQELCTLDDGTDDIACPDTEGDGERVRIKKGVTVDSCSSAFVMPANGSLAYQLFLRRAVKLGLPSWVQQARWLRMFARNQFGSGLIEVKTEVPHSSVPMSTRPSGAWVACATAQGPARRIMPSLVKRAASSLCQRHPAI